MLSCCFLFFNPLKICRSDLCQIFKAGRTFVAVLINLKVIFRSLERRCHGNRTHVGFRAWESLDVAASGTAGRVNVRLCPASTFLLLSRVFGSERHRTKLAASVGSRARSHKYAVSYLAAAVNPRSRVYNLIHGFHSGASSLVAESGASLPSAEKTLSTVCIVHRHRVWSCRPTNAAASVE